MQECHSKAKKIGTVGRLAVSTVLPSLGGLAAVLLLCGLLLGAPAASGAIRDSLSLCGRSVLPAVFPMMVMSGILSDGGGGRIIDRIIGGPICRLFGISRSAATAVILGFLCGFPVGAMTAARLCKKGRISPPELCRLLTFINNPSPVFVICAIGTSSLGSTALGTAIWLSVEISALSAGIISRFVMGSYDSVQSHIDASEHLPVSRLIVRSVSSAAAGAVNVCAYTAFFSATVSILALLLARIGLPDFIGRFVGGLFEIVGGSAALADPSFPRSSVAALAAACSWSGISVQVQIVAVCRDALGDTELSFAPMVLSKLFQATLSPILALLIAKAAGLI